MKRHRTPRGSEPHRLAMRLHAMRRLFERHAIALTDAEYDQMVRLIADGNNPAVGTGRAGGTLHTVKMRGRQFHAVWAGDVGAIATFLPSGIPFELRYPEITKALTA